MKKIILLTLITFMMVGCKYEPPKKSNKYEVVLISRDTVYIDAYEFVIRRGTNYIFKDYYYNTVAAINSPICIKQ